MEENVILCPNCDSPTDVLIFDECPYCGHLLDLDEENINWEMIANARTKDDM